MSLLSCAYLHKQGWMADGHLTQHTASAMASLPYQTAASARPSPAQPSQCPTVPLLFFCFVVAAAVSRFQRSTRLDSSLYRPSGPTTDLHTCCTCKAVACLPVVAGVSARHAETLDRSFSALSAALHCMAACTAATYTPTYLPAYVSANPSARASRHTGRVSLIR
ncbi:uncharacterized protein IWZ02DRAFT_31669 [Phyllosticta citriasiana]|uniref:uncharacterized protein n=1 Tax=Phyllosticta citriasiana TaxID=595635 RepID=UPI0030FD5574